jgi:hypothetical protein
MNLKKDPNYTDTIITNNSCYESNRPFKISAETNESYAHPDKFDIKDTPLE